MTLNELFARFDKLAAVRTKPHTARITISVRLRRSGWSPVQQEPATFEPKTSDLQKQRANCSRLEL